MEAVKKKKLIIRERYIYIYIIQSSVESVRYYNEYWYKALKTSVQYVIEALVDIYFSLF